MYILLYDTPNDRLGSNITFYTAQILFAHNNKMIIKFKNDSKEEYAYYNSIFIKILFNYIDIHNKNLYEHGIGDDIEHTLNSRTEYFLIISNILYDIKCDYISYFHKYIYPDIKLDITNLPNTYTNIPFNINKTILVHLRLDDRSHFNDYDGSICANYYKEKIKNNEICYHFTDSTMTLNQQAPLSNEKVENIIKTLKKKYTDYEVILLTSPKSDTSSYNYKVIKNDDENYDLYLLSMCKVVVLSRSTYAISSLLFNKDKDNIYIPLWGHTSIFGFDTIYDNNDKSIYEYFY